MNRILLFVFAGLGVTLAIANCPTEHQTQGRISTLVRVYKGARRLQLIRDGEVIASYGVALGGSPVGHKQNEGDERTPEGRYVIDLRNDRSVAYRALRISYPNAQDADHSRETGSSPGGFVEIHGIPRLLGWIGRFHRVRDWTNGCIAVTNTEMDEVMASVRVGTPIDILLCAIAIGRSAIQLHQARNERCVLGSLRTRRTHRISACRRFGAVPSTRGRRQSSLRSHSKRGCAWPVPNGHALVSARRRRVGGAACRVRLAMPNGNERILNPREDVDLYQVGGVPNQQTRWSTSPQLASRLATQSAFRGGIPWEFENTVDTIVCD